MFIFKQKILGDNREKEGIKWHMIPHFPIYIDRFGPPCTFDMVTSERTHGYIKNIFDSTSKRYGTTSEEIVSKVMTTKAVSDIWRQEISIEDNMLSTKSENAVIYTTPSGIVFETTSGALSKGKVMYSGLTKKFLVVDPYRPFVNPILTPDGFANTIQGYLNEAKETRHDNRFEGIYVMYCKNVMLT